MHNNIIILLIGLFKLISCGRKKSAFTPDFERKSTEELVQRLNELNQIEWDFLNTKSNVKVSSEQQNNSFKASLRMKRDSAMLINISFAGIPIVQTVLSADSLILLNRKDKGYTFRDKSALDNFVNFPVEYEHIQDLLIGKPLLFDSTQEHIQVENPLFYELISKRPRDNNSRQTIELRYFLSPKALELQKAILYSPIDETTMEINYLGKHEKTEGLMLPEVVDIVINSPKGKTNFIINYNKPDISQEKKITLNIPENYVPCP